MADTLYGTPPQGPIQHLNSQAGYDDVHPAFQSQWVEVPADTVVGATFDPDAGAWTNPAAPAAPTTPIIGIIIWKSRLTIQELIAFRASTDAGIMALLREFVDDPRMTSIDVSAPFVIEVIGYAAGLGGEPPIAEPILTPDRVPVLLAPQPLS